MGSFKGLAPIAAWMLRISMGIITYTWYFNQFLKFSFNSVYYFLIAGYVLFTVLLLAGGFSRNNTLTVLSALVLFGLSVTMMFINGFSVDVLMKHFTPAAIAVYFIARGNNG
ncbi:hypothetical protein OU798_14620 [Prolixibacteraceae bacterium Z1-6]|uniref:Uncharacterized protein n=1 Tax=Draconibacterium aestuarii TaxID=2998507 RepID=A0A9X3J738_9BACT|nr:hypothetical protein [Prolixibacteraceae bacterium Z1-6]